MHQPTLLNDDGTASMATMIMSSHHAFRRDIARFIRAIKQLKSGSHLDITKLQDEWRNSYRAGIHGHHTAEDTSIFPDLKNKFPELSDAIQTLTEQHHHIDPLIEQIDHAIEDMSEK
jgi:hemerythrin-like domain-containing protein